MDAARTHHHGEWKGRISLKKKASLTLSIPQRLEGLSVLLLVIAALLYLWASAKSLYVFPVADSYRWYGDETWMLLAWKNLLRHGTLSVPIALGSTLEHSPGLMLGSPWLSAIIYGLPQLLAPFDTDIVAIGRTVSFIVGIACIIMIAWSTRRLQVGVGISAVAIIVLLTTRTFTFATHSARYDMITGMALVWFVGVCAVLLFSPGSPKKIHYFLLGFFSVIVALTISPHLEILLPPVALYIAWRSRAFSSWRHMLGLLGGVVLAGAIVVLLHLWGSHDLSLWSGIRSDNQYGSVIARLPFLKFFSYSAQSHQLWAKRFYLWQEAPAFGIILILVVISEFALLLLRRQHSATGFVTVCLLLALLSAIFFQSTLPYYLAHLLPLTTLAFALHVNEWRHSKILKPAMAIVSLALCAIVITIWRPELTHAGYIGRRMEEANTAAVQAAFEEESRTREATAHRPLVLAQAPAIHELLRDTSVRLMSESFLFFPQVREPIDSTLAREHVSFIVDYNHPMSLEYQQAVERTTPIFYRIGPFLDRSVDYFHDTTTELDTLTLYEVVSNDSVSAIR